MPHEQTDEMTDAWTDIWPVLVLLVVSQQTTKKWNYPMHLRKNTMYKCIVTSTRSTTSFDAVFRSASFSPSISTAGRWSSTGWGSTTGNWPTTAGRLIAGLGAAALSATNKQTTARHVLYDMYSTNCRRCTLHHHHHWLSAVRGCIPSAIVLFRSPPHAFGTVCRHTSRLHPRCLFFAVVWRRISSDAAFRDSVFCFLSCLWSDSS